MTEASVLSSDEDLPDVLPYDPWDPSFHDDPYAVFDRIRETHGPVVKTKIGLALLGFDEVSEALRHPHLGRGNGSGATEGMMPTDEGPQRAFMFMDPPDHTRIRSLVSKSLTPRLVERVRPKATEYVAGLIAEAQRKGGVVDLAPTIFRPLGAFGMNTLMGVPEEYLAESIEMATDGGRGLDPEYTLPQESVDARNRLRDWMGKLSKDLMHLRREQPAEDLMTEMVQAEEQGDRLTGIEVITTAMNIMLPGFSAPQAMMGLATHALLSRPDQLAWFRANPDKVADAVEELIRFDTAVQIVNRTALRPVEIAGHQLAEGQEVYMLLGAANRDPRAFADPNELDLSRPVKRNVGFGHGIHFCVAAPVARLLTQVALSELVKYELTPTTDAPPSNGALAIRSYTELPVVFGERRFG
ncbi:cytochrome P450 [Saccharothrix sp. HUAS TT1]|uniref:cytochrome P450 n=1 Tax=unclassified Saccharothrix TaxID=2593673 RepID=UPI00345C5D74